MAQPPLNKYRNRMLSICILFLITAMRRIRIQAQIGLATNYENDNGIMPPPVGDISSLRTVGGYFALPD